MPSQSQPNFVKKPTEVVKDFQRRNSIKDFQRRTSIKDNQPKLNKDIQPVISRKNKKRRGDLSAKL